MSNRPRQGRAERGRLQPVAALPHATHRAAGLAAGAVEHGALGRTMNGRAVPFSALLAAHSLLLLPSMPRLCPWHGQSVVAPWSKRRGRRVSERTD